MHRVGVKGTEGSSQVGVDVRLRIPVLGSNTSQLPIRLLSLLVVIIFISLSDDFTEEIEGRGAINTTILCILLLQVQEAVIVLENVEVFLVKESSGPISHGHFVLP